ncbi:MAG: acyl-CoA thioesterase [Ruminococcus sp.]|nr:acyl-CoA thioesterase [Ruminococcus sp.]
MNKIYPYRRNIYYYETDKMGVVHHSNYIRIFEEARMDFMRQTGMSFEKIESMGLYIPILSVECNYKKPLVFNDEFLVYSEITDFNGVRLSIKYSIISQEKGVCVTGKSVQCFTDTNMKPVRIRKKFPEIYDTISEYVGYRITV